MKNRIAFLVVLIFSIFTVYGQDIVRVNHPDCISFGSSQFQLVLTEEDYSSIYILVGDRYRIYPDSTGFFTHQKENEDQSMVLFRVFDASESDSTPIFQKTIQYYPPPKPTATFSGKLTGETINKETLLINRHISAHLYNYNIELGYKVKSFTFIIVRNDQVLFFKDYFRNSIGDEAIDFIANKILSGDRILVTNIEIETDYRLNRNINSIQLVVE